MTMPACGRLVVAPTWREVFSIVGAVVSTARVTVAPHWPALHLSEPGWRRLTQAHHVEAGGCAHADVTPTSDAIAAGTINFMTIDYLR